MAGAQGEEAVTEQLEGHCFLPPKDPLQTAGLLTPVSVESVRAQQGAELESSGGAHSPTLLASVRM